MIYTAKCDDQLLYSPYLEEYVLSNAVLRMIDNDGGTFTFSFYKDHPLYDSVVCKKSRIKVYKDNNLCWLGRVCNSIDVLDDEKTYFTESCFAFFNDSLMRPFNFTGSPADFFELVVTQHNQQVSADQQFVLGDCTVVDANDYIVRSSIYHLRTSDVIREKMLQMLGGHIVITYNLEEKPVISWLADIDDFSTQDVEFGENLINFERNLLYDSFCTAIVPLGYNESNEERLTIASVNGGNDYLINTALADVYGVVYAKPDETVWDDVRDPSVLYAKGLNWLNTKGVKYKSRIQLEAEDLSYLGVVGEFLFQTKVIFKLSSGSRVSYLITDFQVDLRDPTGVSIVLSDESSGYVKSDLTSSSVRSEYTNAEKIRNIEEHYATIDQTQAIARQVVETTTVIQQQAEAIIAEALARYTLSNDFVTFQTEIYSRLTQLANSVEVKFDSVSSQTSALGDETSRKFDEIISFIRFLPTTQSSEGGIVIGESTSSIMMKLENDVLYFFEGDESNVTRESAIAYFESGKLFVNEVQVQKISIGVVGQMMYFSVIGDGDNRCLFLNGRLS